MKLRRILIRKEWNESNKMISTPYFCINKKELNNSCLELKKALDKYWNNYIIGYSYKTNSLPWVVQYMDIQGCYSEVVSSHEYSLGRRMSVPSNRFVYNGPIKTKDTMLEVLREGGYVNIDSKRELEWLTELDNKRKYNIGLRVNYDVEKDCPGQSSGGDEGSRFGFCYENAELKKAIDYVDNLGLKVAGLHFHIGSKTRSIDIYKSIAKKACEVAEAYNLDISFVDIGGGYFGGLKNKPGFADYFTVVADELNSYFNVNKTKLIVEPGMSLIGSPISYVTSVIDVKDTEYGRFVITDGTRTHIDPLMHKSSYFNRLSTGENREVISKQVVSGYTCMENDRLLCLNDMPELKVGDQVIYDKVGAYTICLSPLFIKYFPAVYVEEDGEYALIRRAWNVEDYIRGNIIDGQEL